MALAITHLIDGSLASNGGSTGTVNATAGARVLVSLGISVAAGGFTDAGDSVAISGGGVTWTQKGRVETWGSRRATYTFESSATPSSATLAITFTPVYIATWESTKYSVDEVTGMDTTTPFGTAYTYTSASPTSAPVTVSETPDAGDMVYYAAGLEDNNTPSLGSELDTTLISFGDTVGVRRFITAYDSSPDSTPEPSVTWSPGCGTGAVAFVVNVAAGGGGTVPSRLVSPTPLKSLVNGGLLRASVRDVLRYGSRRPGLLPAASY